MFPLCLLFLPLVVFAALPTEPGRFGNRSMTAVPFLAYSFRQTECESGTIQTDVGGPLNVTMNPSSTTCPAADGFENARVGVTVTSVTDTDAMKSGNVGNSFDLITGEYGVHKNVSFSIEVWFSIDGPMEDEAHYSIVNIGQNTTDYDTHGPGITLSIGYFMDANLTRARIALGCNVYVRNKDDTPIQWMFEDEYYDTDPEYHAIVESIPANPGDIYFLVVSFEEGGNYTYWLAHENSTSVKRQLSPRLQGLGPYWVDGLHLALPGVIRIGTSRNQAPGIAKRYGIPGSVHFLAFYNKSLSESEITGLFEAGLPNSSPAVANITRIQYENSEASIDLNETGVSVWDVDANPITGFRIASLPSKGTLKYEGSLAYVNQSVTNTSLLTFTPIPGDINDDPLCVTSEYTTFTFVATDGICDDAETPRDSPNCYSPKPATVRICVKELNGPPRIDSPLGPFAALEGMETPRAFRVTCRGEADDYEMYGLVGMRIFSNDPSIGRILVRGDHTGTCEGAVEYVPGTILETSPNPMPVNTSYTWQFCYEAFENENTASELYSVIDTVPFECMTYDGLSVSGNASIYVTNSMFAGCGNAGTPISDWFNGMHCDVMAEEEGPVYIKLSGYDGNVNHSLETRRYRIDTFPTNGLLQLSNGATITLNTSIPANNEDGTLTVLYTPNPDYFNAICCLNKDPDTEPYQYATCSCPGPRFTDARGIPFNGCLDASGCLDTVDYSAGFEDENQTSRFGLSFQDAVRITVLGVNKPAVPGNLVVPSTITIPSVNKAYSLVKDGPVRFTDPGGDTYRVGFSMTIVGSASVSLVLVEKLGEFQNPVFNETLLRISFTETTSQCMSDGADAGGEWSNCPFTGKAYMSDLNNMFQYMKIISNDPNADVTLHITIIDPVEGPGEFEFPATVSLDSPKITKSIPLILKDDGTGGGGGGGTTIDLASLLWTGIAFGVIFVYGSCFSCWGSIFKWTKSGEAAIVYLLRGKFRPEVSAIQQRTEEGVKHARRVARCLRCLRACRCGGV